MGGGGDPNKARDEYNVSFRLKDKLCGNHHNCCKKAREKAEKIRRSL